jgi:hypothetical protein
MITLTVPLPLRAPLVWNTWRQHRLALLGLLGAFVISAALLLATGLQTHAAHDSYLARHCLTLRNPVCARLLDQMGTSTWVLSYLPWLVAVFVGAPLVARDFEAGTYRFAMTQGTSARRQLTCKLAVMAAVVLLGGALLGWLAMWGQDPFGRIGLDPASGISRWYPDYFQFTAVTVPSWGLVALGLGVLAGAAVKRVVPAMAVALAAVIVAVTAGTGVNPHVVRTGLGWGLGEWASGYLPAIPLTSRLLGVAPEVKPGGMPLIGGPDIPTMDYPRDWPGPHGSLLVGGFFTRAGMRLPGPDAKAMVNHVPKPALTSTAPLKAWLAARKIRYWIRYQPASRYWLFQGVLAAILLAVAVGAGFTAVRLACRRR